MFVKDPSGNMRDSFLDGAEDMLTELPVLDILVVDDSELNRKMITKSLAKDGHYFTEAVDGAAAVETVSKAMAERRRFDLITMDNVFFLDSKFFICYPIAGHASFRRA